MRTTKEEREKARQGCTFYHHKICVQSPCYCLKDLKDKKKTEHKAQ